MEHLKGRVSTTVRLYMDNWHVQRTQQTYGETTGAKGGRVQAPGVPPPSARSGGENKLVSGFLQIIFSPASGLSHAPVSLLKYLFPS